jgi:hypothetical protein
VEMTYDVTNADRRPLPQRWFTEDRYLGYRAVDEAKPWAHHMRERSLPPQSHITDALAAGPFSAVHGPRIRELADHLNRPGYRHLETGWTINEDGHIVVAVLTDMPGVTGEMWDWWFGWHSADSSRYKLWHPDAHQFAVMGEDRNKPGISDRQRYENNVSYINEYIGATSGPVAIRFVNRDKYGFATKPGEAVIVANGGSPSLPISQGWLVHQIRSTDAGSEMRSRFVFGDVNLLPIPRRAIDGTLSRALSTPPLRAVGNTVLPRVITAKRMSSMVQPLLYHCAVEMNHLATFLPKLYQEFKDLP